MNPIKTPNYSSMKTLLENDLSNLPEKQRDNEMFIFDIMVNLRESYNRMNDSKKRLSNILDEAISKKEAASENIDNVYLENILSAYSDFKGLSKESCSPDILKLQAPAFIIVLNYDRSKSSNYRSVYNGTWYDADGLIKLGSLESKDILTATSFEDNAVLINDDGEILAKNVLLTRLDPNKLLRYIKSRYGPLAKKTSGDALGFNDSQVHSRNKNALAASYNMHDVVIYTLAEETGHIRRMYDGRITHSTAESAHYPTSEVDHLPKLKQVAVLFNPFKKPINSGYESIYSRKIE